MGGGGERKAKKKKKKAQSFFSPQVSQSKTRNQTKHGAMLHTVEKFLILR